MSTLPAIAATVIVLALFLLRVLILVACLYLNLMLLVWLGLWLAVPTVPSNSFRRFLRHPLKFPTPAAHIGDEGHRPT